MSLGIFKCPICCAQKISIAKYLTHIEFVHQCQANFSVSCGLNGCPRTYCSVKYLRQHMRLKHAEIYKGHVPRANNAAQAIIDTAIFNELAEGDVEIEECDEAIKLVQKPMNINDFLVGLQKHFALFVLGTGEQHGVPSVVQHKIAEEVRSLFNYFTSNYNNFLISHLEELGIDVEADDDLRKLFETQTFFDKALSSVTSHAKILAYCKSHLAFIAPRKIDIYLLPVQNTPATAARVLPVDNTFAANEAPPINDTPATAVLASSDVAEAEPEDTCQYIPILQVLERVIRLKGVYDSIKRKQMVDIIKNADLLTSYADGSACKEHAVFGVDQNALRLHMYIDEFEVCNPIGSHRLNHKLCAFYFFVGNLEEQYHSQLKFIHLCLLVKEKTVQKLKYNYEQILKPLIADLNVLRNEGILVNLDDGRIVRLFGALATVSSDNLSAHALAGFKRVFNSGRMCRFCMAHYDEREEFQSNSQIRWRTEQMHIDHVQAVLHHDIDPSVYGVEHRCALADLPYFSVTSSFPPDIMHDILEGVIPVTLKHVINSFGRALPVADINAEIGSFCFGKNDLKNKPVLLPLSLASVNIVGSASEKLSLFRMLPFFVGYRVAVANPHWLLYLQLRDIVDYILSPSFPLDKLSYLQVLIEEFLGTFINLFPGKMTPKFHFLLHYPALIKKFGPLKYLWCMRFEAKHQYFKKLASVSRNFKNIAKTLANRHQLKQCWEFTSVDYLGDNVVCSGEVSFVFSNLTQQQQDLIIHYYNLKQVSPSEVIWKCNVLTLGGNTYKIHDVVIVGFMHAEDVPLFFKIFQLLRFRETWFFLGKLLVCRAFNTHLHAYHVREEDDFTVLQQSELCDHQLLDCYTLPQDGCMYVSLKYSVFL